SRFEPIEQLRNDYVTSLQDIIKATNPKTKADSAVSERHAQIRTTALFADGEVLRIARRLEGKITEKNAIPKSDLQESTVTPDAMSALLLSATASFDELQAAYQLSHAMARILDLAQAIASV